MSLVKYTGTYRGYVIEKAVNLTGKSSLPQLSLRCRATEYYDEEEKQWIDFSGYEENEASGYLVLFSKTGDPIFHIDNIKKAFGWDGASLKELDEMDVSTILFQFRVEENEYEGKKSLLISQIDHADAEPGSFIRKLDADEVKKLDAMYATALRKKSGGPKPKSVPEKPKAAKPKSRPEPEQEPEKDPKAAAKKKHDAKKARGEAAEAKAAPKPPVPTKPEVPTKPPAEEKPKPTSVAEALGLPETCNQTGAWETCWSRKPKSMSDEILAEKWNEIIDEQGGEDAINKENLWTNVRNIFLELHGDDIPF